jgi:hypothetical protein
MVVRGSAWRAAIWTSPVITTVDGPVYRWRYRWRQRDQDGLVALAADLKHAVPCSSPRLPMLAPRASKIRRPSRRSIAISAKSLMFPGSGAAVARASKCRVPESEAQ